MAACSPVVDSPTPKPILASNMYNSMLRFSQCTTKRLQPRPGTRSSAVTVILRFTNEGQFVDLSMLNTSRGLTDNAALIAAALPDSASAEILFIKRAANPRDRWSGHVALPGGRQDGDESLRHTSAREAMEEVGLNVESADYVYLGALDDRYTNPINLRQFLIATHVFLQIRDPEEKPKLDVKEVASCRWVPLATFYNAALTPVSYPMRLSANGMGLKFLSLGSMDFPGILLPEGEEFFPPSVEGEAVPAVPSTPYVYHLWGITLDIIEDLSVQLELCTRGSISYLPRSWNPIVALYVWHHRFIPHSLKGAPFWCTVAAAISAVGYLVVKQTMGSEKLLSYFRR